MPEASTCPECGAPLPADAAPDAPCQARLMKIGLTIWTARQVDSDSGDPPRTEVFQPFQPPRPETLNARFAGLEVLELLGHGADRPR